MSVAGRDELKQRGVELADDRNGAARGRKAVSEASSEPVFRA